MNNSIQAAAKKMAALIGAGALAISPVAATINMTTVTAFADKNTDTADTKVSTKIKGLDAGVKVYAYQIIKANYDSGFTGYDFVNADVATVLGKTDAGADITVSNIGDSGVLTKAKVDALATAILSTNGSLSTLTSTTATAGDDGVATLSLGAGTYVVLVSDESNATHVYNPIVISNAYASQAITVDGTQYAADTLVPGVLSYDGTYYSDGTTAKKTNIDITKQIAQADDQKGQVTNKDTGDYAHGDDLQVGDTGHFTITTQIPLYSDAYKAKTLHFDVVDNQEDGKFSAASNIVVKVGDANAIAGTDYTLNATGTVTDGKFTGDATDAATKGIDFQVVFTDTFIKANIGKPVVITYDSVLQAGADQKLEANEDTATVTYTNDVFEHQTSDSDTVYEYSFPITVLKTDQDGAAITGDKNDTSKQATFSITRVTLADKTFTEVTAETGDKVAYKPASATTDETTGKVTFNNLDEGYYKIVETKAPSGYALNTNPKYIKVEPLTYDSDGKLTTYKITEVDSTGTAITTDTAVSHDSTSDVYTLTVKDSPVSALPSTGARSALILTIAGSAVMVTVMAASRKKKMAE